MLMPQVSIDLLAPSICAGVLGFTFLLALVHLHRRRARQRRDSAALREKIEKKYSMPFDQQPQMQELVNLL